MYSPTSFYSNTPTATTCSTTAGSNMFWINTATNTIPTPAFVTPTQPMAYPVYVDRVPDHIVLELGHSRQIDFPDGTIIHYNPDGSFEIKDENAKVVYKAAGVRDFNPFINASDKLEDFIRYCGDVGVRQGDMLGIPIKHFVQWLVIEAARADGEEQQALEQAKLLALPKPASMHTKCRSCGRFFSPQLKADGIEFCRPECLEKRILIITTAGEKNARNI